VIGANADIAGPCDGPGLTVTKLVPLTGIVAVVCVDPVWNAAGIVTAPVDVTPPPRCNCEVPGIAGADCCARGVGPTGMITFLQDGNDVATDCVTNGVGTDDWAGGSL